ncbi:hypothetical protein KC19_8G136300 [Ceratodon purpureus]|uniref:Uncharacterized protein n=1 Tax=Ceratodon purpureus TaxID=3225 RepID=A0A8T0H1T8_CERPU|nr:hypothetical protein KC19_8G136300 [Ceratodon purpureus]
MRRAVVVPVRVCLIDISVGEILLCSSTSRPSHAICSLGGTPRYVHWTRRRPQCDIVRSKWLVQGPCCRILIGRNGYVSEVLAVEPSLLCCAVLFL